MSRRIWTVRRQLLLLFGVMLVAATAVLALDAYSQYQQNQAFRRIYDNTLNAQWLVRTAADSYGTDTIGVTFKVRNGLMSYDQGIAEIDHVRERIDWVFDALEKRNMTLEQQGVFFRINQERKRADAAILKLRGYLAARNIHEIGTFADTELFPALDPLVADLGQLIELKSLDARARLKNVSVRMSHFSLWRIGLSLVALLVVLVAGRAVLRNIYRGIEQLVRLSKGMRAGNFDVALGTPAKGDVGEVLEGFLVMREEVKNKNAELRESEARAQQANRAKSTFLATMSHEIRTPMIGITGMLELLEHTPLNTEQKRHVAVVQSSAQSLLQIIGDILDFSKIESGHLELSLHDTDLRLLVEHAVGNYLGATSSKGLTLEAVMDDNVAPAHMADPLRLRQILSNFLSNAVKFTASGGVTVRLERLDVLADGRENIALRVSDSGIGISEAQTAKLFQPFTQADSGTARQYGGTGLGLSICRQLAELMEGTIELTSMHGEGSTFSLIVPLKVGDPASIKPERTSYAAQPYPTRPVPTIEQARQENSLVLVVDDHPTNREVLAQQLALAGFASERAANGAQGLQQWKTGRYALVLTDIHMPGMDGYQLTHAIRKLERESDRPHTPIVAITANVSKGEVEHCLTEGMDDFLGKPVRISKLSKTLRHWLPHVEFANDDTPVPEATEQRTATLSSPGDPIDTSVLVEITEGDHKLTQTLLQDFLTSTHRDLAHLQQALGTGDNYKVTREAHRIKGAAALIGAHQVQLAAAKVEQAGQDGDSHAMAELAGNLSTALADLTAWIKRTE